MPFMRVRQRERHLESAKSRAFAYSSLIVRISRSSPGKLSQSDPAHSTSAKIHKLQALFMIQSSGSPEPIATHLPTNPTSTMISLAGKVISVTGSASGMGLATAKALFARGASLSLADYREDALT